MYFFIDETGHTGSNLFDSDQPEFLYGILTSPVNLDDAVSAHMTDIRRELSIDCRIHAHELGEHKLELVADRLLAMQQECAISFETVALNKYDYAIMSFFDQVFDSGCNEAVSPGIYWTPWKYVFLFQLTRFFDSGLALKAWSARNSLDRAAANKQLSEVCAELIKRMSKSSELMDTHIVTVLRWAKKNPSAIYYSATGKRHVKDISPNLIAFQGVIQRICDIALSCEIKCVTVDKQQQFGSAQRLLLEYYQQYKDIDVPWPTDLPKMNVSSIPGIKLKQISSAASIGLELVDVYLWLAKKFRNDELKSEPLQKILRASTVDDQGFEISIRALKSRWLPKIHEMYGEKTD